MPKEKKLKDSKIKKKPGKLKKFVIIIAGIFVILFLIGVFSEDTEPQTAGVAEVDNIATDSGQDDEESGLKNGKDAESDNIVPDTETNIADSKPNTEDVQGDSNGDITDNSDNQPDEMDEYICSVLKYAFQDKKNGKKIAELYEKALDADRDEFICLTEEKKIHMFSDEEVWYKKSLDTDNASFKYYGEINRDGKPDGMGMLVRNWDELYRDSSDRQGWTAMFTAEEDYEEQKKEVCVEIVYIGGFKDGFKEGYGVNFGVEGRYGIPVITDEGEFKHGKMDGSGISYIGLAGGTYDEEFNNMLAEIYFVEYSDTINNGLLFPSVAKSNLYYEGMYKEGEREGKGKEYYWGENEDNKLRLKYEGEFKNSHYSGNGTLYFEDGTVWYKGEFKNGKYDGKGILYDEQGKVLHEGKFEDGDVK